MDLAAPNLANFVQIWLSIGWVLLRKRIGVEKETENLKLTVYSE